MKKYKIRTAQPSDALSLFELRNDPSVRARFFDSSEVRWEDHLAWFSACLVDPATRLFVAEAEQVVGNVRYSLQRDGSASTSVSVNPLSQGLGIASHLLRVTSSRLFEENFCSLITAEIKLDNIASIVAFKKAGFIEISSTIDERVTLVLSNPNH